MTYPGNTSLSQEIRERILGTFDQTLQLAAKGSRQEALLGCDFILRLDPVFEPARTLQERLQSGEGPVDVADVRAALEAPAAEGVSFQDLGAEVDSMELEGESNDLEGRMRAALEARRFEEVLEIAGENQDSVIPDPTLREIAETAQSRLEAGPYVSAFLESAREALSQGHRDEAERLAEKARSLDPSHPDLRELFAAAPVAGGGPEAEVMPEGELLLGDDGGDDEPLLVLEPTNEESTQEVEAIEADLEDPFADAAELSFADDATPPAAEELPTFDEAVPAFDEELLTVDDALANDEPAELTEEEATLDFGFDDEPAAALQEEEASLSFGIEDSDVGGDDTDRRIVELLAEGQAAFDEAEYQAAIDAWSRIFLIDIDHAEAAQRIDEARRLKAEAERKIEELFRTGEASLKAGDSDEAKEAFERVLEIQPNHLAAREYLDQLASGTVPMGGVPDLGSMIAAAVPEDEEDLQQEILVPPDEALAEEKAPKKSRVAAGPSRRIPLLAAVVALVVVVAAAFLFFQRDTLFPNAQDTVSQQTGPGGDGPDPIDRATRLHDEGKTKVAISQLKRIRPDSPHYEQAQVLLTQWEAATAPIEAVPETAPSVDALARQTVLIADARRAEADLDYLQADELLTEAAALAPLDGEAAAMQQRVQSILAPYLEQISMKKQGDCEFLIPTLWRAREEPGDQPIVDSLLVDCYYNLGVLDLQRSNLQAASEKFQEAMNIDPDAEDIRRAYLFAETYKKRGEDLLYRIFVKYLPSR